jgi:hypothetical protein
LLFAIAGDQGFYGDLLIAFKGATRETFVRLIPPNKLTRLSTAFDKSAAGSIEDGNSTAIFIIKSYQYFNSQNIA